MKMTKKILFGAVIAALVIGLASCKEVGDITWEGGLLSTGSGSKTFKVQNQKNEGKNTIRGMKQFDAIRRAQATCIVQMFDQTEKSSTGMVGFATYVTENADNLTEAGKKTMNFLVTGVTNNQGTVETYLSYFCNVDPDNLSTQNFGVSATRETFDASVKTPYEIVIKPLHTRLNKNCLNKTDGTLKVAIDFKGNTDGTIDVEWWQITNKLDSGDEAAASFDLSKHGSKAFSETVKVTTAQLGTSADSKNGYIYAYANIYGGQTLNAQWNLYNVSWTQANAASADDEYSTIPFEAGDILFE